jgi:two-component system, NarL family, sensor histidine kinase LiaS
MSNIVKRHVAFGMLYSVLMLAGLVVLYIFNYPIDNWRVVLTLHDSTVPFIIAAPIFVLFSGALLGLFSGLYWRKRWHQAAQELEGIREGQQPMKKRSFSISELQHTWTALERLQLYMNEQAKIAQKLTNERVIDREEEVQRIVSEERNRLARELHDSVSQELFAASMLISALTESEEENAPMLIALKQLESMVQQSQLEMRALLLHLRPAALKGKTLQEGMDLLLVDLQAKVPLSITWELDEFPVEKGIEDQLFRIVQESVSNTLRHAKAESLAIKLLQRDGFIILLVTDDGIGFEMDTEQLGAYGLQNMKERAAEIGAHLRVVSVPKQGTRLEVRVPMLDREEEEA